MGHWYTQTGQPMHWVPMTKDPSRTRPTTIRDAKKMKLVPSVTEILKVADKPGLNNWRVEQAYLQARTMPPMGNETDEEFIARCKKAERDDLDKVADKGSDLHDACERYFKGLPVGEEYKPTVDAVWNLLIDLTGIHAPGEWVAEKTFAGNGFGGMVDLHTRSAGGILVDYKSKDFTEDDDKRLWWPEQDMQLSAYGVGLSLPKDARRISIFLSRQVPGLIRHHEWDRKDDTNWKKFACLLAYWKLDKGYSPE